MNRVALKMLTGDRGKFLGIVFGVAFASLLMAHQLSIFCGVMDRTTSQIRDVRDADIWVMDPKVRHADEVSGLASTDLQRVRGVSGVAWAMPLFKGKVRARLNDGNTRNIILLGIDDATFVGAPGELLLGQLEDLRRPEAILISEAGYAYMWPGEPLTLGRTLEINDRRAVVVGVCKASKPFQTLAVGYTRYSEAVAYAAGERKALSFVLVKPQVGVSAGEVCRRIEAQTGLQALTREEFCWKTMWYFLVNTGIPVNFGITVLLGFVVGVAIAGQTFYLFTVENLKQFGALKAMGLSNARLVRLILLQAVVVGALGYGIGIGLAAMFFEATQNAIQLSGIFLLWQVMGVTAVAVFLIVLASSLLSIRRVLVLEPAAVFRS
jgi:putative ABC transport system permease protein